MAGFALAALAFALLARLGPAFGAGDLSRFEPRERPSAKALIDKQKAELEELKRKHGVTTKEDANGARRRTYNSSP